MTSEPSSTEHPLVELDTILFVLEGGRAMWLPEYDRLPLSWVIRHGRDEEFAHLWATCDDGCALISLALRVAEPQECVRIVCEVARLALQPCADGAPSAAALLAEIAKWGTDAYSPNEVEHARERADAISWDLFDGPEKRAISAALDAIDVASDHRIVRARVARCVVETVVHAIAGDRNGTGEPAWSERCRAAEHVVAAAIRTIAPIPDVKALIAYALASPPRRLDRS